MARSIAGDDTLEEIVKGAAEYPLGIPLRLLAMRLTGVPDGRKVAAVVSRLERAELAKRLYRPSGIRVRPTPRGRVLDAELAQRTVARGGRFAPRNTIPGHDAGESLALR